MECSVPFVIGASMLMQKSRRGPITSRADRNIIRCYDHSASHVTRTVTLAGLVSPVKALGKQWPDIVELPGGKQDG